LKQNIGHTGFHSSDQQLILLQLPLSLTFTGSMPSGIHQYSDYPRVHFEDIFPTG